MRSIFQLFYPWLAAFVTLLALPSCDAIQSCLYKATCDARGHEGLSDAGTSEDGGTELSSLCFEDSVLGRDVAFAFDAQGVGHYAYVQGGTTFVATTRPGDLPQPALGLNASVIAGLTLDAHGRRYLLFHDTVLGRIAYACEPEQERPWQTVPVTEGIPRAIQVDASGAVHVLAVRAFGAGYQTLHHVTNRSGSWELTTIGGLVSFTPVDLAVDAQGHAHVTLQRLAEGATYYTNASGTWERVPFESQPGGSAALVLDATGRLHLLSAYQQTAVLSRKAASGSGWENLFVMQRSGRATDLWVDSEGNTHALFHQGAPASFIYVSNSQGRWNELALSGLPAPAPSNEGWARIALGAGQQPFIAYSALANEEDGLVQAFHFARSRPCP